MKPIKQSDVLIIGGGIMGTTTAFFLRRRVNPRSVTVLERGLTGQQASGTNFGGVRRQGRMLPQLGMANRALQTWYRSRELLGEDVEFLPSGHTRVCYHAHDADNFDQYALDAREYGLDLEVLHGAKMFERFPFLGREVRAASISPLDGHANPRLAAPAFGRAAARLGAAIVENTDVIRVEKDGGGFRVETATGERYQAEQLVVCAGAWAGALSAQFGEPVPLSARGPQMAVTEPVPYIFTSSMGVFTSVKEESVYFRQIPRGNIILGGGPSGPADAVTRRAGVLPEHTVQQLAQFRRLAPAMTPLHVIRVWSGVEGYLPDSEPVIGASGTADGLFYAFGFSGSGFQIGPGVGETLAELLDTGATTMPLDAFSIGRFQSATSSATVVTGSTTAATSGAASAAGSIASTAHGAALATGNTTAAASGAAPAVSSAT